MSEYINRDDVLNCFHDWFDKHGDVHCADEMEEYRAVESLPSIEVVRCKDCKYWRDDHTCREHSLVSPMGANEFCSRGERGKQDDET